MNKKLLSRQSCLVEHPTSGIYSTSSEMIVVVHSCPHILCRRQSCVPLPNMSRKPTL